jgi:hypothetical protein
MRINFFILLLFWLAMLPALVQAETRDARYGGWERYYSVDVLKYPDFELRFTGSEPGPFFPASTTHRMGTIYKFRVTRKGAYADIRWSSGTGEIGPVRFEIGGESYMLEMAASAILDGFVSEDNVLVWRQSEWQRRLNARMKELNDPGLKR